MGVKLIDLIGKWQGLHVLHYRTHRQRRCIWCQIGDCKCGTGTAKQKCGKRQSELLGVLLNDSGSERQQCLGNLGKS